MHLAPDQYSPSWWNKLDHPPHQGRQGGLPGLPRPWLIQKSELAVHAVSEVSSSRDFPGVRNTSLTNLANISVIQGRGKGNWKNNIEINVWVIGRRRIQCQFGVNISVEKTYFSLSVTFCVKQMSFYDQVQGLVSTLEACRELNPGRTSQGHLIALMKDKTTLHSDAGLSF